MTRADIDARIREIENRCIAEKRAATLLENNELSRLYDMAVEVQEQEEERYVIVLPADEDKAILMLCDEKGTLSLVDLQHMVDGYIEIVPVAMDCALAQESCDCIVMIVNEDGKVIGLEPNWNATDITLAGLNDLIVGNAVLMIAKGEELYGFTREAAKGLLEHWGLEEKDAREEHGKKKV